MAIRIPLSVPVVGPAERELLLEALDSGWITPAGPQLDAFEAEVARCTGRARAVGVSSGTAALHLALVVAGVREGDAVLCPTLSFIASANAISHARAVPVFVDCDATGNMAPGLLEEAIAAAERTGRRVGAVLAVDLYGKVADHDAIGAVARAYGAPLVVDAAESLGARRGERPAGSHGDIAAVSFNGNKIVTASSGGAVLTDDDELADRARHLATQAREPVPHYEHRVIGYNYRLSNILAALGLAQLRRLPEFLTARRAHREAYRALCAEAAGLEILGGDDEGDNCWITSVLVDPAATGQDPVRLREHLARAGIEARPVFAPLHSQPVYADPVAYPRVLDGTADRLFATGLSLPSSPASLPQDVAEVCERLAGALVRTGAAA
ncbi:DegT/DnrJ/EryC1/StrS family aminotransferase [Brachybacterium huguangmaarense]